MWSRTLPTTSIRRLTPVVVNSSSMRSISIGTDMRSSVISLQAARQWSQCADDGSNRAVDNAITLAELFGNKTTIAVFGVPAPFTGTCTHKHYPGYRMLADDFLASGCDSIVCYSVSDPYALDGWQQSLNNDPHKIRFLADPDGSFAHAYGLEKEYWEDSLGHRSKRFSMIVMDGRVAAFHLVKDAATDAQTLLTDLKELKDAGFTVIA